MKRFVFAGLVLTFFIAASPSFATMRYLNQVHEWSCKYCHNSNEPHLISGGNSSAPAAERYKLNAVGMALYNSPSAYRMLKTRGASHTTRWYKKPWQGR